MLAYEQRNWAMSCRTLAKWDWNKASQTLRETEVASSSWNPWGIHGTYAGFILPHQPKRDLCAAANETMYVNVPMNVLEDVYEWAYHTREKRAESATTSCNYTVELSMYINLVLSTPFDYTSVDHVFGHSLSEGLKGFAMHPGYLCSFTLRLCRFDPARNLVMLACKDSFYYIYGRLICIIIIISMNNIRMINISEYFGGILLKRQDNRTRHMDVYI